MADQLDLFPIEKPRVRVSTRAFSGRVPTLDSFQNTLARVGADPGSGNQSIGAGYSFNPVSRYRTELEFAYRGSWIVRVAVDAVADDMTRAGIELGAELSPDDGNKLFQSMVRLNVWQSFNQAIKWARLYGGAICVPIIDGQDPKTPLKIETVGPGQFKGLLVLDRWMCQPSTMDLVTIDDLSRGASPADLGLPRYYDVGAGLQGAGAPYSSMRIHHSRALRFDGLDLPFFQKLAENYWGLSVIEPLYDRLVAFDSTTQGAAQLVYKAHLRVWKMAEMAQLFGEDAAAAALVANRVRMVAQFQSNEGITLIDRDDELQMSTYSFAGLSDMMLQFGQQVAGSLQIPMTRLFGQAPAGLNRTGESDLRNYEDGILHQQELRLRRPVDVVLRLTARSEKVVLPEGFWWNFKQLRQLTDEQKGALATQVTGAVTQAEQQGLVSKRIAAKELQQSSRRTGIFTNIDDDYLEQLDADPPQMGEPGMEGMGAGDPGMGYPGMEPGMEGEAATGSDGSAGTPPPEYRAPESEDAASPSTSRRRPQWHVHLGDSSRLITWHGLPIYLETLEGETRAGLRGWANPMPCHYGFFRMTGSAEGAGEGMDVFVGPDESSETVYVVNQLNPETGEFDEHKPMVNFLTRPLALRAYQRSYSDGMASARVGSVATMSVPDFKKWLETHDVGQAA